LAHIHTDDYQYLPFWSCHHGDDMTVRSTWRMYLTRIGRLIPSQHASVAVVQLYVRDLLASVA
jgi:hypothetical protein